MAEGVESAFGLDRGPLGRREQHAGGAERQRGDARHDRADADRGGRLVAAAGDHRGPRTQPGRRGRGLRDRPRHARPLEGRAATTRARSRARRAISADQSRAARSNSIVPEPSARSTACSPVSRSRTKSLGRSTCAIAAQTSGSWRRSHSSFGAVNPGRASLPVIAIRRSRPTISRIASHSAAVRWSFHRIAGRRTSSRLVERDEAVHLAGQPDGLRRAAASAPAASSAARTAIRVASHHRPGSCSLHRGCGVSYGVRGRPHRSHDCPRRPCSRALVAVVETSSPRTRLTTTPAEGHPRRPEYEAPSGSPSAEQEVDRELVEPLVGLTARGDRPAVDVEALEPVGAFRACRARGAVSPCRRRR